MRWKEERASNRSEIVKVDGLSKLTNGVVFVFGCVYVCVAILGLGIISIFFLPHLLQLLVLYYDHFFA